MGSNLFLLYKVLCTEPKKGTTQCICNSFIFEPFWKIQCILHVVRTLNKITFNAELGTACLENLNCGISLNFIKLQQ